MHTRKREEAFTLVELLLVVTIIGILAGAVILNFSGTTNEARIARAKADISTIGAALNMFEITIGQFPTSDQGLQALVENPGIEGWTRPFIQKKTFKDPWGREYRYVYPAQKSTMDFDLFSLGPDGQEGTEDDIGNWDDDQ